MEEPRCVTDRHGIKERRGTAKATGLDGAKAIMFTHLSPPSDSLKAKKVFGQAMTVAVTFFVASTVAERCAVCGERKCLWKNPKKWHMHPKSVDSYEYRRRTAGQAA